MEQRARRKRRSAAEPETAAGSETASGYYARQRARDEAARAALPPLRPGERPRAVTIAAALAAAVAVSNLALLAIGWEVDGQRPQVVSTVLFAVMMAVGAYFIWHGRYWAVLGFQVLLAVTMLFAFLALLTASNARAVILCVTIMALSGALFWSLVKSMARLQAPPRRTP